MNLVLSILTGSEVDASVIDQGFSGSSQYTAGCFIKTQSVYSISIGTVISIEQDPKNSRWTVTVKLDDWQWIRYCNLSAVKVKELDEVTLQTHIGYSYKGVMRLEYCTGEESDFPVRISSEQKYKHDPSPIIFAPEVPAAYGNNN